MGNYTKVVGVINEDDMSTIVSPEFEDMFDIPIEDLSTADINTKARFIYDKETKLMRVEFISLNTDYTWAIYKVATVMDVDALVCDDTKDKLFESTFNVAICFTQLKCMDIFLENLIKNIESQRNGYYYKLSIHPLYKDFKQMALDFIKNRKNTDLL